MIVRGVELRGDDIRDECGADQSPGETTILREGGENDRDIEEDRDDERLRRQCIHDEHADEDDTGDHRYRSSSHISGFPPCGKAPCAEERRVSDDGRPIPTTILAELGLRPTLTVYLAGAPGAGKTHRLLSDAREEARAGRRVAIGWLETQGRTQLEALAAELPRIPARRYAHDNLIVDDFDLDAALAGDAEIIILDELAHTNPIGARCAKRWQPITSG